MSDGPLLLVFTITMSEWISTTQFVKDKRKVVRSTLCSMEHPSTRIGLKDAIGVVGWVMPPCSLTYYERELGSAAGGYGDFSCGGNPDGVMYDHYNDVGAVYEHRNDVKSVNKAFYTQGDLQLTDQLSVTLGVRYSKDARYGVERRGGYTELTTDDYPWLSWAIATAMTAQK